MLHDARVEHESATRWPRANFWRPDSRRSDARQRPLPNQSLECGQAAQLHILLRRTLVPPLHMSLSPFFFLFIRNTVASLKLHLIMHTAGQHTT